VERAYLVWPHCASIRKSMAVLSRVVLASYTIYSTHVLLKLATSMIILDGNAPALFCQHEWLGA